MPRNVRHTRVTEHFAAGTTHSAHVSYPRTGYTRSVPSAGLCLFLVRLSIDLDYYYPLYSHRARPFLCPHARHPRFFPFVCSVIEIPFPPCFRPPFVPADIGLPGPLSLHPHRVSDVTVDTFVSPTGHLRLFPGEAAFLTDPAPNREPRFADSQAQRDESREYEHEYGSRSIPTVISGYLYKCIIRVFRLSVSVSGWLRRLEGRRFLRETATRKALP